MMEQQQIDPVLNFLQSGVNEASPAGVDPVEAFLQSNEAPKPEPDYFSDLKQDWENRWQKEGVPTMGRMATGQTGFVPGFMELAGNMGYGAVNDAQNEAIKRIPNSMTKPITDAAQAVSDAADKTQAGRGYGDLLLAVKNAAGSTYDAIEKSNPDAAALIRALGNIGSATPALNAADKAISTAGDAITATAKAPGIAVDAVKSAITPLTEKGRAKIAAAIIAQSAADPAKAAEALKNAQEYIPQSYPTAGPASGDTGLLSLERTLRADPENYFAQRIGEQNIARNDTMNALAGTPGDVAKSIEQRSAATGPLYEKAENVPVAPNAFKPILDKIDETVAQKGAKSDLGKTLLTYRAKIESTLPSMTGVDTGLVDEAGDAITRPSFDNTLSGPLSQIYREERDQLEKTGMQPGAYGASVKGLVKPINYDLGKALEAQSPELAQANGEFATRSKDINAMQNMQDLTKSLTGTTKDTAGNYFYEPSRVERAIKSGGMNTENGGWQPFDKALDPNQQHYLNNLQADLARDNLLNSPQVRPSGSPTYSYTAGAKGLNAKVASLLEKTPWAGKFVGGIYEGAADKVKAQIIAAMLDPKKAAEMLNSYSGK